MLLEKCSMFKKIVKPNYSSLLGLCVAMLAIAVILVGCKETTPKPPPNGANEPPEVQPTPQTPTDSPPKANNPTTATSPPVAPVESKKSLIDVLRTARSWGIAREFMPLFGRDAPDFTLTDINGKEHKLSDYRGKNVILDFWATWCPPCKMAVPHLIELRNTVGEDKLAIMAISYISPRNTEDMIKNFAAATKANYLIFTVGGDGLGDPYDSVASLPTVFFIDPEGKIKIVTSGLMPLDDSKAVLEAEWPEKPI